jgi:hypothetical protein
VSEPERDILFEKKLAASGFRCICEAGTTLARKDGFVISGNGEATKSDFFVKATRQTIMPLNASLPLIVSISIRKR